MHLNRRVAISSVLLTTAGCASRYPKGTLAGLGATRLAYSSPRTGPDLKLQVSAWAALISAAALAREQNELNANLGDWREKVVPSFTGAFETSLRSRGTELDALPQDDQPARPSPTPLIRSYLTAGFVYKTLTSPTYAPFVQVVLEALAPGGRIGYHQLYVASDRPFNLFMTNLPAGTNYVFSDLESLKTDSGLALDALASLAAQLGERFASELLA